MYHYIAKMACTYNFLISLIVTEIREGVGIRRGSVIGDFPLTTKNVNDDKSKFQNISYLLHVKIHI